MPIGPLARPRGRHAKPSRTGQPVVAGVLAASVGVPLVGLAGTGAAAAQRPDAAPAVLAFAAVPPLDVQAEREVLRASRQRPPAPEPVEAPAVTPPPPPEPAPEPDVLPGCTGRPTAQYANGRIPQDALCDIPGHSGHLLRADAARALVRLEQAYRAETGRELCVTDTYRSYAAQVKLRRAKGRLAAAPGHSNHGTGIAVDFCGGVESFGTAAHRWMRANAGRFGWTHPSWAGPGGRKPEPWHWEYRG